eukprot:Em0004g779a
MYRLKDNKQVHPQYCYNRKMLNPVSDKLHPCLSSMKLYGWEAQFSVKSVQPPQSVVAQQSRYKYPEEHKYQMIYLHVPMNQSRSTDQFTTWHQNSD